jgi:HK97 family phage portal protein
MEEPQMALPSVWKPHPWLNTTMFNIRSDTGIPITAESAISHTPLWHGLLLLGGDAGSLNIRLDEKVGDELIENTSMLAYKQASVRPNPRMCPASFWEMMVPRAILWGNAICEIKRTRAGGLLPVEMDGGMIPLPPETTEPFFDDDGKLWIKTREMMPNGKYAPPRFIDPDDTYHLPNLSTDGFWGRGLIQVAKNRIANGLGLEKQHNRFMRNGMQPDWLFSFPTALGEEYLKPFEDKLRKKNRGLENVGRSLVVDNDMKATQLGMTFEHAQFNELVQMDVKMVASLLGIPAIMLNAMDQMTFSNTEEAERWYINRSLRRWLNKIAQELAAKLLTDSERERFVFSHDIAPLLLGRMKERFESYAIAISSRMLNPNEARGLEGWNPYEGGDEYANPNTMSGGGNDEDVDQPEDVEEPEGRKIAAAKLKSAMAREDESVLAACREVSDLHSWLDEYYHGKLLQELFAVVPNCAADYCQARYRLWVKFSDHVRDQKKLGELVKAQKQTSGDRVAGLLTEEFACPA